MIFGSNLSPLESMTTKTLTGTSGPDTEKSTELLAPELPPAIDGVPREAMTAHTLLQIMQTSITRLISILTHNVICYGIVTVRVAFGFALVKPLCVTTSRCCEMGKVGFSCVSRFSRSAVILTSD